MEPYGLTFFNMRKRYSVSRLKLSRLSSPIEEWNFDVGGLIMYNSGKINGVRFKPGHVFVISKRFLV